EGLPARPGGAARPLSRGVAPRPGGVVAGRVARLPALRLPQPRPGGDLMRVLVALLGLVALARAEAPADTDLRRLFPQQADVFVPLPGGLSRLRVPPEVLAACRPGLSDVRLLDRRGA